MVDQQVTGTIDEVQAPIIPEQAEPQVPAPAALPTEPDPVAAAAVDLARGAAEDVAQPDTVGRHLSVSVDQAGLTMHAFDCTAKGYRGWRWAVTLAHVPGSDRVTVCDTVLLPGAESIMAPDWVPWSDRLAPGDLGPGDELPFRPEDPNLVPGYTVTDEDDSDQQLFWELGLGRERLLGPEGVSGAADRWHRGPHGPTADIAVQSAASCVTCAYFVPLSGRLRQSFGACANEWSPADGSVVTVDFGCGAHSETDLEMPAPEPLSDHILDDTVVEEFDLSAPEPSAESSAEPAPGIETGSMVDDDGPQTPGNRSDGVGSESSADAETGAEASGDADAQAEVPTRRTPRDAGGTMKDLVEPDTAPPVQIAVEPTIDPEPVASPEDLITVHPLGESAVSEPVTSESAVDENTVNASVADEVAGVEPVVDEAVAEEAAPVSVEPVQSAEQDESAERVESAEPVTEVVSFGGVPEERTVKAEPEEDQAPPVALGPDARVADVDAPETVASSEVSQGQALEPVSEYNSPADGSVATPGQSIRESDGALAASSETATPSLSSGTAGAAVDAVTGPDHGDAASEPVRAGSAEADPAGRGAVETDSVADVLNFEATESQAATPVTEAAQAPDDDERTPESRTEVPPQS
ncbi:DUF3027 domain-containing protein [Kineosporia mesophila]|uniref:DUF3027 domain-containing protein n=1 Tax=Kineosporia mesophila TaxID=566012 RepID=A0ABP7AGK7_9ACTN|nr:DUF3027 domain-containing protein [Kineosporia mesophila]MCD5350898.1 DUF3027 domain-containing protein [Kineosporia mesophila]